MMKLYTNPAGRELAEDNHYFYASTVPYPNYDYLIPFTIEQENLIKNEYCGIYEYKVINANKAIF